MDTTISLYKAEPFGDDLMYCVDPGIMYQKDMTVSVEYAKEYYEKYVGYEGTNIADALNRCRTELTERHCASVLDVGIGSGEFIKKSKIQTYGYDINPCAIQWLKEKQIFLDPYQDSLDRVQGISLWDTLEHIPRPDLLLCRLSPGHYVFISIPILPDLLRIRENKHYKPNEHYYYFTKEGLLKYMSDMGFECDDINDKEIEAGREGVLTFVFRKS